MTEIERKLFPAPILNKRRYPQVSQRKKEMMAIFGEGLQSDYVGFTFFRKNREGWFADIYIYGYHPYQPTVRFVIAPGYRMSDGEERKFDEYMQYLTRYDQMMGYLFYRQVRETLPEIHIKKYSDFPGGYTRNNLRLDNILLHLYYTTHPCGIREQLYKMGCECIAGMLSEVEEYNLIATNVKDAFGLPANLVRILNSYVGVRILQSKETRQRMAVLYQAFHGTINQLDVLSSRYQYRYLNECYEQQQSPAIEVLRELSNILEPWEDEVEQTDWLYEQYMEYIKKYRIFRKYHCFYPRYPDLSDQREFLELCETLQ
ncbi:MAG: hypothetical protein LUE65_01300 [Clostridiales bacterium]|nr:hypothetical protein [Clostridiales bacterium]